MVGAKLGLPIGAIKLRAQDVILRFVQCSGEMLERLRSQFIKYMLIAGGGWKPRMIRHLDARPLLENDDPYIAKALAPNIETSCSPNHAQNRMKGKLSPDGQPWVWPHPSCGVGHALRIAVSLPYCSAYQRSVVSPDSSDCAPAVLRMRSSLGNGRNRRLAHWKWPCSDLPQAVIGARGTPASCHGGAR